jgi:glutamate N-acetyltransferase/amino-acid N-acetyltransferase
MQSRGPVLRDILRQAARRSFNRVVVDGDTSTNDVALCTATGAAAEGTGTSSRRLSRLSAATSRSRSPATAKERRSSRGDRRGAPDEDAAPKWRGRSSAPRSSRPPSTAKTQLGPVVAAAGRAGVEFDPYAVSLSVGEGVERTPLVLRARSSPTLRMQRVRCAGYRRVRPRPRRRRGEGDGVGVRPHREVRKINGKYTT